MRVTQRAMNRQYLNNMNTNLDNMNKLSNKITSRRKFDRVSEDTVGAAKAMGIRKELARLDMYESNLKTADGLLSAAESVVMNLSSISQNINSDVLYATNGSSGPQEKEILADKLRTYADEMVKELNGDYAGRKIFGGTVESEAPFEIRDVAGKKTLFYNDGNVDGTADEDAFTGTKTDTYVDIGIGLTFTGTGVDSQSGLKTSTNGIEVVGCGTDTEGDPKNLISLILRIADKLEAGDDAGANALTTKVEKAQSSILGVIADIGNRSEYIEFNLDRITSDRYTLLQSQNDVESTDTTEEITDYKTVKAAYDATLQMGSYVIPTSIFDFIR